jgi:hypothetical protein
MAQLSGDAPHGAANATTGKNATAVSRAPPSTAESPSLD